MSFAAFFTPFGYLLLLVPLAALVILPGLLVKFAAFVMGRARISWRQCFIFGILVALSSIPLRAVALLLVLFLKISLPLSVILALSSAIYLIFGGWYFKSRLTSKDGELLGWPGGLKLMAIYLLLLGLIFAVLFSHTWHFPMDVNK